MLLRQDKHKAVGMQEALVRHMFLEVGDKPYEGSGIDYFSEVFSDPGVQGHVRASFKIKDTLCILHPSHKEGSTEPSRPLRFWRPHPTARRIPLEHSPGDRESFRF